LILRKHFDLINTQLHRYLNNEKLLLINVIENLFDKYAIPVDEIEREQNTLMAELNNILVSLGYRG
ncbi:hypothetical protein, partial [Bacillus safensis]